MRSRRQLSPHEQRVAVMHRYDFSQDRMAEVIVKRRGYGTVQEVLAAHRWSSHNLAETLLTLDQPDPSQISLLPTERNR